MNPRLAGSVLAASVTLLLMTAWRAARVPDVQPLSLPMASPPQADSSVSRGEAYSLTRVMAAVNKDPFHPLRRRPARRLLAPSQSATEGVAAADPAVGVQVIGTAVSANGSGGFAMCAWGGAPPRIVRVGERVGDWTLHAVTPGAAQFVSPTGATVVVRIAKAGGS